MAVKWHGYQSVPKDIHGGGPQGATLGLLEYLSQSNDNADCVGQKERFRFVDDLSILEVINFKIDNFPQRTVYPSEKFSASQEA